MPVTRSDNFWDPTTTFGAMTSPMYTSDDLTSRDYDCHDLMLQRGESILKISARLMQNFLKPSGLLTPAHPWLPDKPVKKRLRLVGSGAVIS